MFGNFDVSASGMRAQRIRMNVIANNLAHMDSLTNAQGQYDPYRRRVAIFGTGGEGPDGAAGVRVTEIVEDPSDLKLVHDPNHKFADADGNVRYPNVNMVVETADAIEAARAYEANVAAYNLSKSMVASALRILA